MKRLTTRSTVGGMATGLLLLTMAFGQEQSKPEEYSVV
jgi:hypothetical protein